MTAGPPPPVPGSSATSQLKTEEEWEPRPGPSLPRAAGGDGSGPQKEPAAAEPTPPAKRARHGSPEGSVVWRHFALCPDAPNYAACNHCKARVSRGQNVRRLGTTALWGHLRSRHPGVLPPDDSSRPRVPGSSLAGAVSATRQTLLPKQRLHRLRGTWGDRRGRYLLTRLLAEMIALDDQPLAVVENIGFCRVLQALIHATHFLVTSSTRVC
uniref:BED-type domain-containing protein n=1 Tax=Salvator merianae TaxID=96440 RepID=A0A8D0AWW8_SALMN